MFILASKMPVEGIWIWSLASANANTQTSQQQLMSLSPWIPPLVWSSHWRSLPSGTSLCVSLFPCLSMSFCLSNFTKEYSFPIQVHLKNHLSSYCFFSILQNNMVSLPKRHNSVAASGATLFIFLLQHAQRRKTNFQTRFRMTYLLISIDSAII